MLEIFKKRHSTRNFINKEVEKEKLTEILEAANSSPSAGNLKSREIIVVEEKQVKDKLVSACRDQEFVSKAGIVLVFCSVPSRSSVKYGERGRNLYALQDATIAVCFAWLEAVALGLSACWVGAFNESEVKEILKIKSDWQPIALLPIGYAKE